MLGLAASGCAPPSAPPTAADDQPPLLDQMKFESAQQQAQDQISQTYGKKLRIRYHPSLRTVAFIEAPAVALPSASSQGAALVQFVMKYRSLYGVLSEQDLDYVSSEVDGLGMRHLRYRQQKNGVPVWGTELVGHLDGRGALRRLHARLMPLHLWPSASSRPLLLAEAARQQALTKLRAELPSASLSADAPSLFYLPSDKRLALAYRIDLEGQAGDEPLHLALFLDAQSGAELLREDLVARVDVAVPALGRGKGQALGHPRRPPSLRAKALRPTAHPKTAPGAEAHRQLGLPGRCDKPAPVACCWADKKGWVRRRLGWPRAARRAAWSALAVAPPLRAAAVGCSR